MAIQKYIEKNSLLVERCKKGDRKAQFELYKLYSKAMYNVCFRFLNHEGEAEDVLQEAFIDAFSKISSFRQESSFGLWLKQIVVNKSINQLRKRRLQMVELEEGYHILEDQVVDDFECNSDVENQIGLINNAIGQLPEGYRAVLNLYLFEGYDHEEISQVLGISESTSRTQFMRGKKKLLELISVA